MADIVGIGANVHDTLITVSQYPTEDTKLKANSIKECGGGPCATGLVTAAKLGADVEYIGALANDSSGKFLLEDMKRFGMSVSNVDMVDNAMSFSSYVLLNDTNASRTCVFNKQNLPDFEIDENKKKAIESAKILMVDGNELENAIKGADIASKSGTKVLYDAGGLYEGVERLLPYADILIPSEEFALGHTGETDVEKAAKVLYNKYNPQVVVITCGVRGGVIFDGNDIKTYPSFKVDAIDSNGAGDVFHGAFAFAAAKGFDYYRACVFSSAVSAIKCTRLGARDGVPGYKETIEFLKECGHNEFEENMD